MEARQEHSDQQPNRDRLWVAAVAGELEAVARREAARGGFDVATQPHGLVRAILHVLSSKELMTEIAATARRKLEDIAGVSA